MRIPPRLIRVCAGIGDNIWLLQKLINAKEKFDFQLTDAPPQRGKQIFDLLPQVANSCAYTPGLKYETIRGTSKQYDKVEFKSIKEKAFSLAINFHLENGRRIEEYLPDLPMTFRLPYQTGDHGFRLTDLYHPSMPSTVEGLVEAKKIGIYMSGYSIQRIWNFWNAREWFDFIQKLYAEMPHCVFVIIGAEWDTDLGSDVMRLLMDNRIPFINTIGKKLPYVVELMQRLDYFIGFPSGMSILNETLHKKTFMFYPPHLTPMMYAWAEEDRIKNFDYIAQLFCTPMEAFKIIADKSGLI